MMMTTDSFVVSGVKFKPVGAGASYFTAGFPDSDRPLVVVDVVQYSCGRWEGRIIPAFSRGAIFRATDVFDTAEEAAEEAINDLREMFAPLLKGKDNV